jgi:hypothetical protein
MTPAPTIDVVAPGLVTRVAERVLTGKRKAMLTIGVLSLAASGVLGFTSNRAQFFYSYLVAYMFVLSLCLGALFLVMVLHLTRAGWGVVVRRIAENMAGVLPWMAVLFIPIGIGMHDLFHHWVDAPPDDEVLRGKSGYLNVPFFYARAVLYFAIWIGLAQFFRGTSIAQDASGDPKLTLRMARVAAPGMLLFALSLTFAAVDWIMSLDPHWFSTIFGVCYFAGSFMAVMGMLALVCMWLGKKGYLRQAITTEHYHDMGKLLFAFMVFWTYVNFSQYMLIWYANLPEETGWYAHRAQGSWATVGQMLIIGHFLVPFAFLMSRHIKRNRLTLAAAAVFLLFMHWLDLQFQILPVLHEQDMHPHILDATTLIGLLCIFLGLTIANLERLPLVPERDPRLLESLRFHNA